MLENKVHVLLFTLISLLMKVCSQCSGQTETKTTGYEAVTISPPGYPTGYAINLNCAWVGTSSINGAVLLIRVTDITLSCAGDAVNVYDGTTNTDASIHTNECQSGSGPRNLGYSVTTTGNVYTEFISDGTTSASEKGFLMYIISAKDLSGTGCSAVQSLNATDTEQYLTSPNFPNVYSISMSCTWEITAQTRPNVLIEILFADIENDASCSFDYLDIQEQGSSVRKICTEDSWTSTTYSSSGNTVKLIFNTDSQVTRRGFLLSYKQTGDENKSDMSDGLSVGIIVGIVIICILAILLVAILVWKFRYPIRKLFREKCKNIRAKSKEKSDIEGNDISSTIHRTESSKSNRITPST